MRKQKDAPLRLGALCSLVYFSSCLTRSSMGAVISEICRVRSFTAAQAAPIVTFGFWSYGLGQLLWGYLGRRLPPKGLMLGGLLFSGAVNLMVPLADSVSMLAGLWFFNGLAQAAIWPPMSQILTWGLPEKNLYDKVCTTVTVAGSLGTFALYLFAPWLLGRWDYRGVFLAGGAAALMSGLLVLCRGGELLNGGDEGKTHREGPAFGGGVPVLLLLALSFLTGMLREGVNTWLPSLLVSEYGLVTSSAILSTVLLPLVGLGSTLLTGQVLVRRLRDEIRSCRVLFALGLGAAAALFFLLGKGGPAPAVVLSALLVGGMYGTHLILTGLVLPRFSRVCSILFLSGLLNFVSYVGAGLASWLFPKIAEGMGWRGTVASWGVVCLLGVLTATVLGPFWRKFQQKKPIPEGSA